MFDDKNEGWIALGVVALLVLVISLILWEPDVEQIGTTIYELTH